MFRPSRFELRIILAILIPAVAPIVASLLFIPQLIEARFAEFSNVEVKAQLDRHVVFYSEFFEAKKREYSATARLIASDDLLLRLSREERWDDARTRLTLIMEEHPEIRSARLRAEGRELLAVANVDENDPDVRPKTLIVPLGLGDAPVLELVFTLSGRYFVDRSRAEEVATLYDASLKTFGQRFTEKQRTYYAILAVVAVMALAFGIWLSRAVTRRIATLAAGTERAARGDFDFVIPVVGNDEISELSRRFNRMLRAIREAQRRIIDLEKISGWQDFARRLAHEIKNPLTPIRLSMQELRRRTPEADPAFCKLVQDVSEVIEDETGRLTRLVNEFSQFARLPDIEPIPTELRSFMSEFMRAYNGFDGRVRILLPEQPISARVDRDQLRQVLHNLVLNGLEASATHSPVDVRLAPSREGRVCITVEDSGPGVAEPESIKIFEPYYTTKPQGTGLGLAIAKKIILQHDGNITVHPRPGGGAQFTIDLPAYHST
ncbi:MAG: ATP-binding protein [Myxococcota bacterium]